jgi:HNH endonuclease
MDKICAECGGKFRGRRQSRFCSVDCLFWSHFDRSGGPDACWLWRGTVNKTHGYGVVDAKTAGGKRTSAHRHAYRLHYSVDPGELSVLHNCDVRLCGNPAHLRTGTHKDNWQDAVNRCRPIATAPGEANMKAKLTTADVLAIRRSAAKTRDLVRQYGMNDSTIRRIVGGETWQHIIQQDDEREAGSWQRSTEQPETTRSRAHRQMTVSMD